MDINEAPIRVQGSKLRPMAKVIATNAIEKGTNMRVFSVLRGAGKKVKKIKDKDKDGPMVVQIEDLRKWFGKGKTGDWVRVGTDGEIKGDCARDKGEGKPKCMPRSKAHSMKKKDRASAARRKRAADPDVDRPGTGNKPIMVKTDKKKKESVNETIDFFKVAKAFDDYAKKSGGADRKDFERVGQFVRDLGNNSDVNKQDATFMKMRRFIRGLDTDVKDGVVQIMKKHGMYKHRAGMMRFVRESVNEEARLKAGDKVQTPQGTVEIKDRDTRGMRGKQDKYEMILTMKDGKKVSMGSHPQPSASAVKNIAKRHFSKGIPSYMAHNTIESVDLEEKNVPTNPKLWAKFKAQAKAKFDVYPSAYANGWASKQYKAAGGGWKSVKEDLEEKAVSKAQQKFFGMVRAKQKGEMDDASPEVKKAADSMSKKDVKDFAKTKHKGLPDKKVDEDAKKLATKDKERYRRGFKNFCEEDPCWDTHKQVGTKMKGGKQVPNCVPKEDLSKFSANKPKSMKIRGKRVDLHHKDGKHHVSVNGKSLGSHDSQKKAMGAASKHLYGTGR